jgi:hypothetical protein
MARQFVWVKGNPKPVKLDEWGKNKLKKQVETELAKYPQLHENISRIDVKAGRVYFYYLYEPQIPEGAVLTKSLIDGKYFEVILARITVYDKDFKNCTLDFQRHNDQWMTIDTDTLAVCIEKIETSGWFDYLT